MSPVEHRKTARRTITYPAMIDTGDGAPPRECTLADASQEGAQLVVADPESLPERFILALSADGAARRYCRVIWRREQQVGVEFIKEPKRSFRAAAPLHFGTPDTTQPLPAAEEPDQAG